MFTTVYLLASFIIAGLAQARAMHNAGLALREECRSGEAGAFFINAFEPGQPSYPEQNHNKTYSASEASGDDKCLEMDTILETLGGSQKKSLYITNISPIAGGYCQLFTSDNCGGDAMMLLNPENWHLAYPDKIICPGVGRNMIPAHLWNAPNGRGIQSIKCFRNMP